MTTTRKYYVMVPAEFSYNGEPYWQELRDVKTLTAAQQYVRQYLDGLPEPEIAVSLNGGDKTVVSKKAKEGKWGVIYK